MSQYDTLNVYNNYNFIIEFYLQTIHTFVLARRNTIIFDSTKIILKLAIKGLSQSIHYWFCGWYCYV